MLPPQSICLVAKQARFKGGVNPILYISRFRQGNISKLVLERSQLLCHVACLATFSMLLFQMTSQRDYSESCGKGREMPRNETRQSSSDSGIALKNSINSAVTQAPLLGHKTHFFSMFYFFERKSWHVTYDIRVTPSAKSFA